MGQVASIREGVANVFSFTGDAQKDGVIVGVVIAIVAALVIVGGLTRIAKANEKNCSIYGRFLHSRYINYYYYECRYGYSCIFINFRNAFSMTAVAGGVGGAVIKQAITWGFKRGVFSNEAGLGSSVMVHSASNVKEPVTQGLWGIFEVFFDTMIVCTLTALLYSYHRNC